MWKTHQFLTSIKKDAHERKVVLFFGVTLVSRYGRFTPSCGVSVNGGSIKGDRLPRKRARKMFYSITHPFNGHLSGTTQVSRYQKGKPIWILLKQETECGSGISWAVCKSAPHSRQITTPVPTTHHSVFYRPDALPAAQTNSVNALKAWND